ncbi:hypothetical protein Cgig2_014835 [Carnegiea gigantea]|uniref:Uncharacterized protein n=1 Tax=Carnegiea gigantea TaxID=171969 RepID=A0A9Q1QSN6_9CARY|nr:hypothetical protein Cgig2_014835 [Carnegiea gigantea]
MVNFYIVLYVLYANTIAQGKLAASSPIPSPLGCGTVPGVIINVKSFGVQADGRADDSRAFNAAWQTACNARGNVILLIPKGTYLVSPLRFKGPCREVSSLTVLMEGYLKATTDLSVYKFGSGWIEFAWIEGLTLAGGGVLDGQGAEAWPFSKCSSSPNCDLLPTVCFHNLTLVLIFLLFLLYIYEWRVRVYKLEQYNLEAKQKRRYLDSSFDLKCLCGHLTLFSLLLGVPYCMGNTRECASLTPEPNIQNLKFVGMNRTIVHQITSLNSKFFHIALVGCRDFTGSELSIFAPDESPNTDGIHLERSTNVHLSRSIIGTGDDCISVGQGNSEITITNITCGPGHGISVGSLGRYPNEQDVKGLVIRNCTMIGTSNGIRIKTWPDSPGRSTATDIRFENIMMKHVRNPIIIDQEYCPFDSCSSKAPSRVRLSDIYFKNITGTSASPVAVMLSCSKGTPCENIYLQDVHLNLSSGDKRLPISSCENVKARYIGAQMPPPCP